MLTIDGKQLRNLEEQVEKNKQDIEYIINEQGSLNQFGIKVVGQIDILNNLPTVDEYKQSNPEWEYGDAYAVGVTSPYSLYILTRANGTHTEDYWFNIGQFPLQGPKGDAGDSSSIAVGTTTTLIEGSPARVENVGTTRDATFNFYIPRGDKGETGDAATITLGRVEKGTTAQITNSGDEHNAVFNFTLPQGDKGDKGDAGDSFQIVGELANTGLLPEPSRSIRHEAYIIPDEEGHNHIWGITGPDSGPILWTDLGQITGIQGQAATISVGTTTTLPAGQSATVSNVGTEQDAVFNFGIPKGADGTAASIKVGTVTTLPAGQMATVQNSGTAQDAVFNFGIPKGQDGDGVQPEEVALTPATATQGTLTDEQLLTLQSNKNNWISLNNELYRLNDEQTNSGYLVYSHEGQDSTKLFQLKAITITISTKAWVLMTFTPQSQLTFDTTPTENSLNPVTSAGIYERIGDQPGSGYHLIMMNVYTDSDMTKQIGHLVVANVNFGKINTFEQFKNIVSDGGLRNVSGFFRVGGREIVLISDAYVEYGTLNLVGQVNIELSSSREYMNTSIEINKSDIQQISITGGNSLYYNLKCTSSYYYKVISQ